MKFDLQEVMERVQHFTRMGYSADKAALWLGSEFHEDYFAKGKELFVKYIDEQKHERVKSLGVFV